MSRQSFLVVVAAFLIASLCVAPFVSFEQDARDYWVPWQLATGGLRPWHAYAVEGCNYPPVILYVLSVVEVARAAMLVTGYSRLNMLLLKLPSFVAQLAGAIALVRALRAELGLRRALAIAAAWLASPALFANAAMWCQWDAFLALFAMLSLLAIRSRRPFAAGAWAAVAVATKVQAIFLLPALGAYLLATRDRRAIALAAAGAVAAAVLCFAPMALGGRLRESTAVYVASVDTFPRRSVNAWNPYGLLNAIELRGVTIAKQKARIVTDARAVLPKVSRHFTYKRLGLLLFGSYVIAMLVVVWRRRAVDDVIVGVPLCGVAMFLLATQMHERYLAPPAALMTLWWPLGRAYRWHLLFWSASAAANQVFAMGRYAYLGSFNPVVAFEDVGGAFACLNVIAFAHLSWLFFRRRPVVLDQPSLPSESCVS